MTFNIPKFLMESQNDIYKDYWTFNNSGITVSGNAPDELKKGLAKKQEIFNFEMTLSIIEGLLDNNGGGIPSHILEKMRDRLQQEVAHQDDSEMLLHMAIEFATVAHKNQTRKGSKVPYISHPFDVAMSLQRAGADIEVVIAGVLHDTVEDTDITLQQIEDVFGERVKELVASCSEDKSKSWKQRKEHTITKMNQSTDFDVLLLSLADKTANLRSMKLDLDNIGDTLWDRFNAPKNSIAHYYSKLNDAFALLNEYNLYWENTMLYQNIFNTYYLNDYKTQMYQTNGEESYCCDHSVQWHPIETDKLQKLIESGKINRIENDAAYALEKEWANEYE